jgi:hypothetical protein
LHKYTVDFTINGDNLDEQELSNMLGLTASVFLKKGEPLSPGTRRERSTWSIHFNPPDGTTEWRSLEEGLRCLIGKLQPLEATLRGLKERFWLNAYCGHFGSGFGGGPSISPETLHMLAELGLALTIKTYWGSTDPE